MTFSLDLVQYRSGGILFLIIFKAIAAIRWSYKQSTRTHGPVAVCYMFCTTIVVLNAHNCGYYTLAIRWQNKRTLSPILAEEGVS